MAEQILTAAFLREYFDYNPETGVFVYRKDFVRKKAGGIAGMRKQDCAIIIKVFDKYHFAHRLAWLYVHGEWPKDQIDHIDGNRANNRLINLRDVSVVVNQQNQRKARVDNKCGFLGVIQLPSGRKRFKAAIRTGGSQVVLGYFFTPEEAHETYLLAKRRLHEGCTI